MATCYKPECQRGDLPVAALHHAQATEPCAHARPDGEPCTAWPGQYPADIVASMLDDDRLWAAEFHAGVAQSGARVTAEAGAGPSGESAPAPLIAGTQSDRLVTERTLESRQPPAPSIAPVRAVLIEQGKRPDKVPLPRAESAAGPVAAREVGKPDRRAEPRRRDDKRRQAIRRPADEDVDSWEP